MKTFENPPYKIFIEDIHNFRKAEDLECWTLRLNAGSGRIKDLLVHTVWIQGKIESIEENLDKITVILNDGTGSAKVVHVGAADLAKSWISTGVYCSAVGYVKNIHSPEVHAIKMTDLSRNTVCEKIWSCEVKELRLILLGLLNPPLQSVEDVYGN